MKDKLLIAVASLFVFAVLLHDFEKPVLAQIRAALTKNIDERGRSPYMTRVTCTPVSGAGYCMGTFPAIPPNRRFVVEYANGFYSVSVAQISEVVLFGGSIDLNLEAHLVPMSSSYNFYTTSMPLLAYYEPGDVPSIAVTSNDATVSPSGNVTLSGYLVDLTL